MKTINKKASTPPETSVSASIQESIYYYCLSQLTANTVFTSLFIAEICVKTMLFDMLFTWHPTYSTQFLRTVLHLVAFCEWFAFRCENDFVTFVLSVQQIVPNNQLDNQKRLCSEVCNHSLSHRFALHRFTSHSTPKAFVFVTLSHTNPCKCFRARETALSTSNAPIPHTSRTDYNLAASESLSVV